MSRLQSVIGVLIGLSGLLGLAFALTGTLLTQPLLLIFLVLAILSVVRFLLPLPVWADAILALFGAVVLLLTLTTPAPPAFWFALATVWLLAWMFAERLARHLSRVPNRSLGLLIPLALGAMILLAWETITRGAGVPAVLLPPPSSIGARISSNLPMLWADAQQTFTAVLVGYLLGCGLGFLVAIAVDRSPFLQRGLLPLGSFVSALPIIGVAPIMVMWFGFDWPSKAAVVVIMTFFPMLVNTSAGLAASSHMERDLMRTYAASYGQTLWRLRLPAAAPFIFNALKINSTLALIGAIVAEFFGSPTVGMGFRISTEVGKLNIDLIWAEIAMAALAGSVFYGVMVLIERAVTFWHPSVRRG
jgi:NitT/TauT family transport system permease protein